MTHDEDAIKGLLGKAFGPEPPLALDREEILRRGRRGLRIRRLATSGGVAAAVVAVILGAAALNGLPGGGSGHEITPAQATTSPTAPPSTSPTDAAPTGPELPLTPTATVQVRDADKHAIELTRTLSGAGVVPRALTQFSVDGTAPLSFVFTAGIYRASALLVDSAGRGVLAVYVRPPTNDLTPPRCSKIADCSEWNLAGVAMTARIERTTSGTVEYSVLALRPDGTNLTLTATNTSTLGPGEVRRTRPQPPVDLAALRAIAVLPGLTFG